MNHNESSRRSLYIVMIIVLPCCMLVTLKICHKTFSKYRHKYEPMHILMINFFTAILLQQSSLEMNVIRTIFPPTSENCWHFGVKLFASFYHSFSIIVMQMDRFIAVKWSIHYSRIVNNTNSIIAICVCIFTAAITVLAAILLDPSYTVCTDAPRILITRTTRIIVDGIPKLAAVIVTLLVLLYCLKTKKRLAKVLPAPVQLPQAQPPQELNIRRLGNEVDVFVRTAAPEISQDTDNRMAQEETVEEKAKKNFVALVDNTALSTMICIIYLLDFTVTSVLGIVFWNCELQLPPTCSTFLSIFKWCEPPRFLSFMILCLFILKKLYRKDQQN